MVREIRICVGIVPYDGQISLKNSNRVAKINEVEYMVSTGEIVSESGMYKHLISNRLKCLKGIKRGSSLSDIVDGVIDSDDFYVEKNEKKIVIGFNEPSL
tara:strand:- start:628 stop:927 length:300 start_codon:yes stop_codon:yes gene_type:complete